jgi:hypothetical protein
MFDVLVAATPAAGFAERIAQALRGARLRVIACEVRPTERPPAGFRVDAAVACAVRVADVSELATNLRATLDGAPNVVGITPDAGSPPAGTFDVLRDDAPATLVVLRVQRAAAHRERRAAKVLVSGTLADVGLSELIASLARRRRTCTVKVLNHGAHAELALEQGRLVHARADGVSDASLEATVGAIGAWREASFEVHGHAESAAPESSDERPTVRISTSGNAADVALAAAVLNAFAAYARAFLSSEEVARSLETSRISARRVDAGIDAFSVSRDGIVSVTRVAEARTAVPRALGVWSAAFFDDCARTMPQHFHKDRLGQVLGGLTRLIEQVGWGASLLRTEQAT